MKDCYCGFICSFMLYQFCFIHFKILSILNIFKNMFPDHCEIYLFHVDSTASASRVITGVSHHTQHSVFVILLILRSAWFDRARPAYPVFFFFFLMFCVFYYNWKTWKENSMCRPASAGFVNFQATAINTWWGGCPRLISLGIMVSTDEPSGLWGEWRYWSPLLSCGGCHALALLQECLLYFDSLECCWADKGLCLASRHSLIRCVPSQSLCLLCLVHV